MKDLRLLVDIMGAGFETVIIYYYFRTVLKDCKVKRGIEILSYFAMMVFTSVTSINYPNSIVLPITCFIFLMILSTIYEGGIWVKIISNLILGTVFVLAEAITVSIIIAMTGRSLQFIQDNVIYYLQGVLISKLLVFIVIKIFEYKKNNSYSLIRKKTLIPLVLMPISSMLVIYIISEKAAVMIDSYISLLTVLTISLIIIANIIIFYLFEKQLREEEEKVKSEFFKRQIESQKKHFEELTKNQRIINKTIHDIKNQLLGILGFVENNENEIAMEYLNLLCDNITGGHNFINNSNLAVDSLLNAKINKINDLDISLKTLIFLEKNNQISDIDLCILLGNAIDNAIEACEKITSLDEKIIKLKIIQVDEYLSIEISNTILDSVKIEKDSIATTKRDKAFHGFGLENMKEIVERYSGHINFEQEENTFTVKILLQNQISSPMLQI